jgi:hypothetical protein
MAMKSRLQKVLDLAGQFVITRKGAWGHEDWERFLEGAVALGIELTDETKRNLGNILESCKCFYCEADAGPAPKKAAAKSRATAK